MIWTADYAKRKRIAALQRRLKPPLLTWCLRRYRSLSERYRHAEPA
jgi:hypothetical protein